MRIQALIFSFFLLLIGSLRLAAQTPQLLLAAHDGWDTPMSLEEMHVKTVFLSDKAFTTFRLVYQNPTTDTGAGTFRFYLKPEQTPRRFAVKLPTAWREAEIVERKQDETAVQASKFFSENHLKEYVFEEKVFQITAQNTYEIIFTYEEKLWTDRESYQYQLPIALTSPLDSFSLEFDGLLTEPIIEGATYQGMNFEQKQGVFGGKLTKTNFSSLEAVSLRIPRKMALETHVGRGSVSKDYYIYANLAISDSLARNRPKSVCLIWDQSHSAGQKNVEQEIELLNQYFKTLGDVSLRLITFTTQIEQDHHFKIKDGNWLAAKAKIRALNYDGATDFGCLDLPNISTDLFIISTDGQSTIGQQHLALGHTPIISLISSSANPLKRPWYWAQQTQGNVILLDQESPQESLRKLQQFPIQFLYASYDTSAIQLVYPDQAQLLSPHFSFTGKLKAKKGTITLNFQLGKQQFAKEVVLRKNTHIYGYRIEEAWAQAEIESLIQRTEKQSNALYRKFILGLSRIYKIPTPHSRFALLEHVEDYVEAGITPPKDLEMAYRLYWQNSTTATATELPKYGIVLDSIAKEYNTWYQRTFYNDYQLGELNSVYLKDIYQTYSSLKEQALFKKEQLEELTIIPDAAEKQTEKALTTLTFLPWDIAKADMESLTFAEQKKRYEIYLRLKKKYLWMPSFYVEAAQVFWEAGQKDLALRVLSNLLEIEQDNIAWIRYISYSLMRMDLPEYAFPLLQKVFKARSNEPQSYRDLALCHTSLGNNQQAVNLLAEALRRKWGDEYLGLKAILISELNHLIITSDQPLSVYDLPEEIKNGKVLDLRILVEWFGDQFPLDVWVIDPTQEKAYYGNKLTKIGGLFADNKANKYGIEQYIIKEAIEGKYEIKLDYAPPTGAVLFPPTAVVSIYKDFGSIHESKKQEYIPLPKEERLVTAKPVIYQVGSQSAAARYTALQLTHDIQDFVFYQQDKKLAAMHANEVVLWDLSTKSKQTLFKTSEEGEVMFKKLALSPSKERLVVWLDSLIQQPEAGREHSDGWTENTYQPLLKIFDLKTNQSLKTFVLPQSLSFVSCTVNGDVLYATSEGIFQLPHSSAEAYLKWSFTKPPTYIVESEGLIAVYDEEMLTIIEGNTWQEQVAIPIQQLQSLAFNRQYIAYATNDGVWLRNYHGTTQQINWQQDDDEKIVEQLVLSPTGNLLAIHPLNSNQVILLDTKTGSEVIGYYHTKTVKLLRFSATGNVLASASEANDIRLRNVNTLPTAVFQLAKNKYTSFECALEAGKVYVVGNDGISTLEVKSHTQIAYSPEKLAENLSAPPAYLKLLQAKKQDWLLYAVDNDAGIALGQIRLSGKWSNKEKLLADWMQKFDFSHTNQVTISNKQNVIVFDKGEQIQVLDLHKLQNYQEGKDGDEAAYFSKKCIRTLNNSDIMMSRDQIIVSESGRFIAAKEQDHIYIWNTDGKLLEIIEANHSSDLLAFGAKDRYVFFEGEGHTLIKWDWKNGHQVMKFEGHRGEIKSLALHANGQLLTASADHTIKRWDAAGSLLKTYFGKSPKKVAFYREDLVISVNEDSTLKFWKLD